VNKGHYEDELVKISSQWHFKRRTIYSEGLEGRHKAVQKSRLVMSGGSHLENSKDWGSRAAAFFGPGTVPLPFATLSHLPVDARAGNRMHACMQQLIIRIQMNRSPKGIWKGIGSFCYVLSWQRGYYPRHESQHKKDRSDF
jgi:hypothetical protein